MKSKKGFIISGSVLLVLALILSFVAVMVFLYVIIKVLPFLIILVIAAMIIGLIYLLIKPSIEQRRKIKCKNY